MAVQRRRKDVIKYGENVAAVALLDVVDHALGELAEIVRSGSPADAWTATCIKLVRSIRESFETEFSEMETRLRLSDCKDCSPRK